MPNPGIFHGLRLEFLMGEMAGYSAAVANGTRDEFTKDVLRRFFKRFPPGLPADEEPTEEELAAVDDSLPDDEPEAPDPQDYAEDQRGYAKALEAHEAYQADVLLRSAQIVRWFAYRQSKPNLFKGDAQLKSSDMSDPMFVMACRLLGKSSKKPRKPIAYNLWAKDKVNRPAVQKAIEAIPKSPGQKRHNVAAVVKIKKELFEKQHRSTRKKYEEAAESTHKKLLKEWESNLSRPASQDPVAKQMCIDGVTSFAQPLLDLLVEFTGMRALLLLGGIEPAAGQLNIIGIHSGTTKGPVKMNFAEAEPKKFHGQVIPAFSDFLRKCYTPQDIKDSAIPMDIAPLLSVIGSKEVTYCAAAGDSYSLTPSLNPPATSTGAPATAKTTAQVDASKKAFKTSTSTRAPEGDKSASAAGKEKMNGRKRDGKATSSDRRKEKDRKKRQARSIKSLRRKGSQPPSDNEAPASDSGAHSTPSVVTARHGDRVRSSHPETSHDIRSSSRSDEGSAMPGTPTTKSIRKSSSKSSSLGPESHSSRPAINSPSSSTDSNPFATSPARVSSSPFAPSSPSPFENRASSPSPLENRASSPSPLENRTSSPSPSESRSSSPDDSQPTSTFDLPSISAPSQGVIKIGPPRRRHRVPVSGDPPFEGDPAPSRPTDSSLKHSVFEGDKGCSQAATSGSQLSGSKRSADDPLTKAQMSKKLKKKHDKENGDSVKGGNKRKADKELNNLGAKRRKPLGEYNGEVGDVRGAMSVEFASIPASAPPVLGTSSSSSVLPPVPTLPPGCCTAIQRTREMVASVQWGSKWRKLVVAWLEYEHSRGFDGSTLLKATHRPSAIGEWIQRARNPYYRPEIDVEDFQIGFWKWWKGMQPAWRDWGATAAPRSVEGDWECLDKAGKNGLASVVAALFFWGTGGCDRGKGSSWALAVEDVSWVLQTLRVGDSS